MNEPMPAGLSMARHCVAEPAARVPERTALVVTDGTGPGASTRRLTFAEVDDAVRATAAGFLARGLEPGDRVLLRLGNTVDYPIAFFGALAAGLVAIPSSSQLTPSEVEFIARDSGARLVVTGSPDEPAPEGPTRVSARDLAAWRESGERAAYAQLGGDAPAFLIYTSGTTASPKGVLHAHRSAWGRRPMYAGWLGLRPSDVMLHAGAFNWTYTLGVGLTDPWANDATAVIYNGPRSHTVWPELMREHGATIFAAVPGVYRPMLRETDPAVWQSVASLRHGVTAGEALPVPVLEAWREATGRELYEAFGMSELSTFVSSGPGTPVRPGVSGRPQPGRRIAVLDRDLLADGGDEVRELATGETGLLAVHRSDPGLMLGYWQRPDLTAEVMRGEWFVTSDLVRLDEEGYVHYEGRADDVMTAMGYRVAPLEVEQVLAQHPGVAEVAVHEREVPGGQGVRIIVARVVPADPDNPPGEDELRGHARASLAAYKVPRVVEMIDVLPRTPNGKLLRRALD